MTTDWHPDTDLDRVAGIACDIADRINPTESARMACELARLCHNHPMKAAQLIMVFAAWFDRDATTSTLWARVEALTGGTA